MPDSYKEMQMSKGSNRRPTDEKKYKDAWERIFSKKPQDKK